ncbi:MAG: histidinol-phosphate transaminase [Clostridia bacterium]|nr:histidinol-phosphate transaminase [Clostridia bacterium]
MNRFLSKRRASLVSYVPGEQPKDRRYIKLNTNESPYPPSAKAIESAAEAAKKLMLYPDPEYTALREAIGETYSVGPECVTVGNGSDEILNFAFAAFCGEGERPAVFPDVTYGFYPIFAKQNGVPFVTVPLNDDFSLPADMTEGDGCVFFIANPNAPTGVFTPVGKIRDAALRHPDSLYVIDEAYVDFGGESCAGLTKELDNVLVTGTFSKSRSMAGARLGFGIGCPGLIKCLDLIRNSINPYNVSMMTAAAGIGSLSDPGYTAENCRKIIKSRERLTSEMRKAGFYVTDSLGNFVFAKHPHIPGAEIYSTLRDRGILVRHFDGKRIGDYNRITVGSEEEVSALIEALNVIIREKGLEK